MPATELELMVAASAWHSLKQIAGIAIPSAIVGAAVAVALFRRGSLGGLVGARPNPMRTPLDAHLSVATPTTPTSTAAVMDRDAAQSVERLEAARELATVDVILADIRDLAGAEEVIYWAWNESRETLIPCAWSTEGAPRPQFFDLDSWAPLVRWSAEERVVHYAGDVNGAPTLAAGPVANSSRLYGAITFSARGGLAIGREAGRSWIPRFAAQLVSLLELFDIRREYSRDMRQKAILLEAVQRLHGHRSAETLANAICETVREITSASAVGLVRWNSTTDSGVLQSSSMTLELAPGFAVTSETLVGRACREWLPIVLEDARPATREACPYGGPGRRVGSLAIIPITGDRQAIGAIVVEGASRGDLTEHEGQNIGLLAAVVRGPLENVWEIEEVSRRARTDPLTGLANRRHFDEQLRRVLAEIDRFGGCCSLVMVDLDHFKQINDTYGHDAGDAVLRHAAQLLSDAVRTVDLCARYGGEEIAILLPQTSGPSAVEVAERLRQILETRPVLHGKQSLRITASFGVASYPSPVQNGDWLFPAADKALYEAKAAGRNCVRML